MDSVTKGVYLARLLKAMRQDLIKAEAASNNWEDMDAQMRQRHRDPVVLRQRKKDSPAMADEMDTLKFFQARAMMYAAVIAAEAAADAVRMPE